MLKIEKIAKSRELNVLLRVKPTLMTTSFIFALSYALFIHVSALLLFHISPFKIGYHLPTFAPISVATELPILSGVYTQNSEGDPGESIPSYLILPSLKLPELPTIHKPVFVHSVDLVDHKTSSSHSFFKVESSLEMRPANTQSLKVSRDLAVLLKESHASEKALNRLAFFVAKQQKNTEELRIDVRVLFDPVKGEIFWWDFLQPLKSLELRSLVVDVLHSLKFNRDRKQEIVSGLVEIGVNP